MSHSGDGHSYATIMPDQNGRRWYAKTMPTTEDSTGGQFSPRIRTTIRTARGNQDGTTVAAIKSMNQEAAMDFDTALAAFVEVCKQVNHEHLTKIYPQSAGSKWPLPAFETQGGPRYVRVVRRDTSQASVQAFVRREDGAILYPAGWGGPVTRPSGVRGNIYSEDHGRSCLGPYGVKTLR